MTDYCENLKHLESRSIQYSYSGISSTDINKSPNRKNVFINGSNEDEEEILNNSKQEENGVDDIVELTDDSEEKSNENSSQDEKNKESPMINSDDCETNSEEICKKLDESTSAFRLNMQADIVCYTKRSIEQISNKHFQRISPIKQSSYIDETKDVKITISQQINILKLKLDQVWKYILPLVPFVICLLFAMYFGFSQNDAYENKITDDFSILKEKTHKAKFNEFIKLIKSKYPNQTNSFWANIESSYRHSILKSKDPTIILIVSDKQTNQVASDLAYDVLNSIKMSIEERSTNLHNLIINPAEKELSELISQGKFDKVKLSIDNKLVEIFSSSQRIALVKNIQLIPPTSMLLFYTYGDDLQSAKFPGIMLLLTLEVNKLSSNEKSILLKSPSKLTGFIENYLFKLWSKFIDEDQLKPLFTRIANNVVFVNDEN